jgi:hypothetical protein
MTIAGLNNQLSEALEKVRTQCPQMRFGQLIATIGLLAEDETGHSLWEVEDAEFAAAVERFATHLERRGSDPKGKLP